MAKTLNAFRNGAVGFIDWLDGWRLIDDNHGKSTPPNRNPAWHRYIYVVVADSHPIAQAQIITSIEVAVVERPIVVIGVGELVKLKVDDSVAIAVVVGGAISGLQHIW